MVLSQITHSHCNIRIEHAQSKTQVRKSGFLYLAIASSTSNFVCNFKILWTYPIQIKSVVMMQMMYIFNIVQLNCMVNQDSKWQFLYTIIQNIMRFI